MTKSKVINVGVNDRKVDLFEGLYVVPNGVAYNSYIIADEKTAVLDTVDANFSDEWLNNVARALGGKKPDYLVVLHVEPDHAASVFEFVKKYPDATVVGNAKTFVMLEQFFDCKFENRLVVAEGDTLSLGEHSLTFVFAPMVHWPEVMVAYDASEKCLYSADAFGKFGALDCDEPWIDEARRYYIGIVGKYGAQVTALFKKLDGHPLEIIRPLHGPVLTENLSYYLDAYTKWATYTPEAHGVLVAYSSIYGHTKAAAELMAAELRANGEKDVVVRDLARRFLRLRRRGVQVRQARDCLGHVQRRGVPRDARVRRRARRAQLSKSHARYYRKRELGGNGGKGDYAKARKEQEFKYRGHGKGQVGVKRREQGGNRAACKNARRALINE